MTRVGIGFNQRAHLFHCSEAALARSLSPTRAPFLLPSLFSPETWVQMGRTIGVAGFDLATICLYLLFLDKAVPFIWHKKKKLEIRRRSTDDEDSPNMDPLVCLLRS